MRKGFQEKHPAATLLLTGLPAKSQPVEMMPDPSTANDPPKFTRLAGMIEGRLFKLLEEIEMQATTSGLGELAKLCNDVTDKTAPPLCCSPYFHPMPEAVLEQYRYGFPHRYRFASDHARRLAGDAPELPWTDELFFRLAIFLPYMEAEGKSWILDCHKLGFKSPSLGNIVERLYELEGLLHVWDGFYKGSNYVSRPTPENLLPLPDFNFFEDAMLSMFEIRNLQRLQGSISTKRRGEKTRRKIEAAALKIDPEKQMPARDLALEIEAHYRVRRKTPGKIIGGKSFAKNDSSYNPKGLKKANIERVLLEHGWQNV